MNATPTATRDGLRLLRVQGRPERPRTWQFILHRTSGNTTRLLVRSRAANRTFAARYIWGYGMGPISAYMTAGMLQGIKDRTERSR